MSNDGTPTIRLTAGQSRALAQSSQVIVPGFPEIIRRGPQCRLCRLVDEDPEVLREAHALYQRGNDVRRLEAKMKAKAPEVGLRTYVRHFEQHVLFEPVAREISDAVAMTVRKRSDETAALAAVLPREEEAEAEDLFDMHGIILKLRARMTEVDQATSFTDDTGRVDTYGIVIWLKLIDSFRQSLESMNRMRNSNKVTKAILQAHTKRQTQLASVPLVARLDALLTRLKSTGGSEEAIAEFEHFAREEAKDMLLYAAKESVKESCDVYRLH